MSDVPNLIGDYGADPTMSHSSASAMRAFIYDCNAYKVVGEVGGVGQIVVDENCGAFIHSGIEGLASGPNAQDDATGQHGKNRSTIIIPSGPNQALPWATFGTGSTIQRMNFVYPDVRWDTIPIEVLFDGNGMVTSVTGNPVYYAPTIKSEHNVTDAGNPSVASRNGGRIRISDIGVQGAHTAVWIRDDDDEDQKGVQNVMIDGVVGAVIKDGIVLGRVTGVSAIANMQLTEGLWKPGKSTNLLDAADPMRRVAMWRRRNGRGIVLTNRSAGLRIDNCGTRDALAFLQLQGGYRGPPLNPGDPEEEWEYGIPYRGLRGGRSNGLFVTRSGGEQCRSLMLVDQDAYLNRVYAELSGHAVDDLDPTNTAAAIEILTDRDIAGNIKKAKNTGEEDDAFKAMGTLRGWTAAFVVSVQECDGPLIRSAANDGHGDITLSGTACSIGQKTLDKGAIVVLGASRANIIADGLQVLSTKRGTQIIAECEPKPVAAHLDLIGGRFSGFATKIKGNDAYDPDKVFDRRYGFKETASELDQVDDDEEA